MKSYRLLLMAAGLAVVALPSKMPAQLAGSTGNELAGVIDIHWHVGPATYQSLSRRQDALQGALTAQLYGMRGLVLKQHYLETASWAYFLRRMVPGVEIWGGIALNQSVGGLNPIAVENVLSYPENVAKTVYFPTFESAHYNPGSPTAVPIRGEDGKLLPEVYEILEIVARYDVGISTGHSSPEEILMLIEAARAAGVTKIFVQHPLINRINMSLEDQKKAAEMGAFLEYVIGEGLGNGFEHWSEMIRGVGPANVIISSDLGQGNRPLPAEGFMTIIPQLLEHGFTQEEVDLMTKINPAKYLGIDPPPPTPVRTTGGGGQGGGGQGAGGAGGQGGGGQGGAGGGAQGAGQ